MVKKEILKAKIERNNFVGFAGKYFIDETSETVKKLNGKGESALIGIESKKKGVYTIIGEEFIYYSTSLGKEGKISLRSFIENLERNEGMVGTGYFKIRFSYKNIVLDNRDKVWLHNSDTMYTLWNTILWLNGRLG